MGIFSKIKDAKVTGGNGNFFGPGEYQVKITEVKEFESQNKDNVTFVAVEAVILACTPESELAAVNAPPGMAGPKAKRGDRVTWLLNMSKKSSLGNFKQFMMAAAEVEENDIDEAMCVSATSAEQPFKDLCMRVKGWNIKTSEGNDFTRITWEFDNSPAADLTAAEQDVFNAAKKADEDERKANDAARKAA